MFFKVLFFIFGRVGMFFNSYGRRVVGKYGVVRVVPLAFGCEVCVGVSYSFFGDLWCVRNVVFTVIVRRFVSVFTIVARVLVFWTFLRVAVFAL